MVNVATGNLIEQEDDVDIPGRGLGLAFRRTYNSASQHDAVGTDGSTPSLFGNGWTNTFDAHMGYKAATNTLSVYDIDGARYDYTSNGAGAWTPPPGMQGTTLASDGGCGYFWTKKSGTIYYFWSPATVCPGGSPSYAGYMGRLYQIYGRNHQNVITFTYSWSNSDSSNAQNVTQIVATHSDGQALTLAFAKYGNYTELQSVTRPDGQQVRYSYDSNGNISDVCKPGNGSVDGSPYSVTVCGDATHLHHRYGTVSGGHLLYWVDSPRWTMTWGGPSANGSGGAYVVFAYVLGSNGALQQAQYIGYANFVPSDSTGTLIQPGMPNNTNNATVFRNESFSNTNYTFGNSGTMSYTDTDGHAANWNYDAGGRITLAQGWTGSAWLVSQAAWDANNDLTATIDPRGASLGEPNPYETDYAYDANGNMIAVAQPQVATSMGTFRPTALFSYDQFNNLTVYCDPIQTHTGGGDWIGTPGQPYTTGDTLCGVIAGRPHYTYDYSDANEPYGVLANSYSATGYETTYGYANGPVFDNYGLPTQVAGASYTQADGTTRTPTQTYTYSPYGDVTSVNEGNGATTLVYDVLNRLVTTTNPDSPNYVSYSYYNSDGSVSKTETPYQHATGTGNTVAYDPDGNMVSTSVYRMTGPTSSLSPDTTSYWFDGEDRLVEVKQAPDSTNDLYANPWITRYIYDLSQGNGVSVSGGTTVQYQAHGNLYKTQELLPAGEPISVPSPAPLNVANTTFQDLNGNAFDSLDRPVTRYSFIIPSSSSAETLIQETLTYDQSSYFPGDFVGRLTEDCNSAQPQQCSWYNYDARSAATQVHFSDTLSPDRSATYDADGRLMTATSAVFGTQFYNYNADGLETTEQEATGGSVTSPATFTHEYYPNDELKQLDVASSALNQTGLFVYSRRPDGHVQTQTINYSAQATVGSTSVAFTYTAAGRLSGRSEAGPGANSSPTSVAYDQYGRLSQENFPTCPSCGGQPVSPPLSQLVWDPQGQLMETAFLTFNYSTRGEALGPATAGLLANGVRVPKSVTVSGNTFPEQTVWNATSGALLRSSYSGDDCCGNTYDGNTAATYDTAGRMLMSSSGLDFEPSLTSDQAGSSASSTTTRSYDDENHTVSTSLASSSTSLGGTISELALYQWGAAGHPVLVGSTANLTTTMPSASSVKYDTLHWDGGQLIFTTNPNGQVDDIKVGTSGDITPQDPSFTGLTFYDRGPDGSVLYCHNSTGVTGRAIVDPYVSTNACTGGSITSTSGYTFAMPSTIIGITEAPLVLKRPTTVTVGYGGVIGMPRADGLDDGVNIIQGVRTYDGNAGQWTSPDALPGTDVDPASQKPYLWNGGNPFLNQDPSGFMIDPTALPHDPQTGMIDYGAINGDITTDIGGMGNALPLTADSCPRGQQICFGKLVIADVDSETAALANQLAYVDTMTRAWTMFLQAGMFFEGPEAGVLGLVGRSFGKLGTAVVPRSFTIASMSGHFIQNAITRGVAPAVIKGALEDPLVVLEQSSGNYLLITRQAAVVLTPGGRGVTTYGSQDFGPEIEAILRAVGGAP